MTDIPSWSGYSTVTNLYAMSAEGGPGIASPPAVTNIVWFSGQDDPQAFRLSGGVRVARTAIVPSLSGTAVADGVTELTVNDLPSGASVRLTGPDGSVLGPTTLTSTPLEVTFTLAGDWKLFVTYPPTYKDAEITISVAAA